MVTVIGADLVEIAGLDEPRLTAGEVGDPDLAGDDAVGLPVVLVPEEMGGGGPAAVDVEREPHAVGRGQVAGGTGVAGLKLLQSSGGDHVVERAYEHVRAPWQWQASRARPDREYRSAAGQHGGASQLVETGFSRPRPRDPSVELVVALPPRCRLPGHRVTGTQGHCGDAIRFSTGHRAQPDSCARRRRTGAPAHRGIGAPRH